MTREEFAKAIAPDLKANGFKKSKFTWHRKTDDGVQVFNAQQSQFGDEYYLNLGYFISALGNESNPPEYRCHVRHRLNSAKEPLSVMKEIQEWFYEFGSTRKIVEHCIAETLPPASAQIVKEYAQQLSKKYV